MAEKYAAFGTLLQRGDGEDPEVFTTIAGVRNIPLPNISRDTIDVTAHDSPGAFEEIIPTIKRTEAAALEIVYDPADAEHVNLKNDFDNGVKSNYRIVFPDAANTTKEFAAYVTGFAIEAPHDGALMLSATLKITGAITDV